MKTQEAIRIARESIELRCPVEAGVVAVLLDENAELRAVADAAAHLRAHVATLPEEVQRMINITGWMTELRNALTQVGKP